MPSQQMLIGLGGASGASDIAGVHGVNSSASTVVSLKKSDDTCCTSTQPGSSGWGDFPYNTNTGMFISGFWSTTEDNKGIWKASASNPYDTPTGLTSPSSASGVSMYPGYNISNSIGSGASVGSTGGFAYYGAGNARIDAETFNYTFSSGLGSALGFVMQFYGGYGVGSNSYHRTPLVKITINSITRMYAPKGHIHVNSTTSAGTGLGGYVVYPLTDSYDNWDDMNLSSISGTQLASSYFEY
tara:strand:- start:282 stop:1007 length:726 start_codon:yes stop_codon:yes gene_type:complete